jgi:hypothetical protein
MLGALKSNVGTSWTVLIPAGVPDKKINDCMSLKIALNEWLIFFNLKYYY